MVYLSIWALLILFCTVLVNNLKLMNLQPRKVVFIVNNKCRYSQMIYSETLEQPSSTMNHWFVGKDITNILGYQNGSRDINRHVDDEDKLTERIVMSGQNREVTFINESGLYQSYLIKLKCQMRKSSSVGLQAKFCLLSKNRRLYSDFKQ